MHRRPVSDKQWRTSKNFPQGFPSIFRSDNGVLKIDYHINDHNTLSGYYFQSEGVITAEDVVYLQPQWRSVQDNRPRVLGINWTWTPNSRLVNVARFGYILMNRESQQIDSNLPPSTYGIYHRCDDRRVRCPIIRVTGLTNLGGSPGWPYRFGPDTVYQCVDYVSYLRGNHAFKFGGDIRRNSGRPVQFGAAKGRILFRGKQAFPGSTCARRSSGWRPRFGARFNPGIRHDNCGSGRMQPRLRTTGA